MKGIPESWVKTSLGDITSYVQRGKSPKYTDYSDLPVINQKCVRWHGVDKEHVKYIHPKQWPSWREERFLKDGDILWNSTGTGTIGRACIYKASCFSKAVVDSHVTIVRCEQQNINPEYVFYFIASPFVQKKIEEMQSGSTNQVELGKGAINETSIPLAPFNEQKRIVAKIEELFSELDKGIESLKTAREQLKVYRQAVLKHAFEGKLTADWREKNKDKLETADELLERINQEREAAYQQQFEEWKTAVKEWEQNGKEDKKPTKPRKQKETPPPTDEELKSFASLPPTWRWVKLGELVWSVKDGPHYTPKYSEHGIPFITGGNVRPAGVDFENVKYISEALHKELSARCKPELGDLLYTKGGTTGIARVNTYDFEFNVWVHVAVLKFTKSIKPFYLQHVLNSPRCYSQSQKYTHGVGNQDLGLTRMVNIILPICSEQEQEQIIAIFEKLTSEFDEIERIIDEELQKSKALRQSILKQAFSGKLVAQDPNDEPASVLLEHIKSEKESSKKKRNAA